MYFCLNYGIQKNWMHFKKGISDVFNEVFKMKTLPEKAHWILPPDNIIVVSPATHIKTIIRMPETFGITREQIQNTYNKYNEPIGFEGKARIDIMIAVMKKGWIRTRFKKNSWGVEAWAWNTSQTEALWKWSRRVTDNGQKDLYYSMYINSVKHNQRVLNAQVQDIFFKREFF